MRRWRTATGRFSRDTTTPRPVDSRGLVHLKMGQVDAAIADYEFALRADPKLASALFGRGLAKLRKGDLSGSEADVAAAKTIQAGIGDHCARYGVQ